MRKLLVFLLIFVLCVSLCACDPAELMSGVLGALEGGHEAHSNLPAMNEQMQIEEQPDDAEETPWMPEEEPEVGGYITMDELQDMVDNNEELNIHIEGNVIYINGVVLDTGEYQIDADMLKDILSGSYDDTQTDPPDDVIVLPGYFYIPEREFKTTEDGLRYVQKEDMWWVIFPDGLIGSVSFTTAEHEEVSYDQAELAIVFTYQPTSEPVLLRYDEYRMTDMVNIQATEYTYEEIDGVSYCVSSETVEYVEYYQAYVRTLQQFDLRFDMYHPVRIETFTPDDKPDGHYELEYYDTGVTKESRGYWPNGAPSYTYRYWENSNMSEAIFFSEEGELESESTYDENGDPVFSTYYDDDGKYWTVETLKDVTRYTFYDAKGNVTSTYDTPNDEE